MSDTELTQFHSCCQAGPSCQGTAVLSSKQSNLFVNSNQVLHHIVQNIEHGVYFSGLFPKVHLTTTRRLLETLKLQCHDYIVLSHNGLLVAKTRLQASTFVPSGSDQTPTDFQSSLSIGKKQLIKDFVAKHWLVNQIDLSFMLLWIVSCGY
jgi:hypothetical protein